MCRQVSCNPATAGIPVVVLARAPLPHSEAAQQRTGAAVCRTKPYAPLELADMVGILVDREPA